MASTLGQKAKLLFPVLAAHHLWWNCHKLILYEMVLKLYTSEVCIICWGKWFWGNWRNYPQKTTHIYKGYNQIMGNRKRRTAWLLYKLPWVCMFVHLFWTASEYSLSCSRDWGPRRRLEASFPWWKQGNDSAELFKSPRALGIWWCHTDDSIRYDVVHNIIMPNLLNQVFTLIFPNKEPASLCLFIPYFIIHPIQLKNKIWTKCPLYHFCNQTVYLILKEKEMKEFL